MCTRQCWRQTIAPSLTGEWGSGLHPRQEHSQSLLASRPVHTLSSPYVGFTLLEDSCSFFLSHGLRATRSLFLQSIPSHPRHKPEGKSSCCNTESYVRNSHRLESPSNSRGKSLTMRALRSRNKFWGYF